MVVKFNEGIFQSWPIYFPEERFRFISSSVTLFREVAFNQGKVINTKYLMKISTWDSTVDTRPQM